MKDAGNGSFNYVSLSPSATAGGGGGAGRGGCMKMKNSGGKKGK